MVFEFATAGRILFRCGAAREVPRIVAELGSRVLLVTGSRRESVEGVAREMRQGGLVVELFQVAGEPDLEDLRAGVERARGMRADVVVGWGGGSAVDAGKAVAALAAQAGDVLDFLEVIGQGLPMKAPLLPCVAVPTTAGTGSEVTRNAVISSFQHGAKASLRNPAMLPRVAVVDPELTLTVPRGVTAATGMDALTQVFEPFISRRAQPFTDLFCREGLRRASRSLRRVVEEGSDLDARTDMCFVSLCGGLALANAGLGAVHGFAAPLGGMYPKAPHGALCAALLPHVARANLAALRAREPASPMLAKFREAAAILTGNEDAEADDAVFFFERICGELEIPRLGGHGVCRDELPVIVKKARSASSMQANPIALSDDELLGVLSDAF